MYVKTVDQGLSHTVRSLRYVVNEQHRHHVGKTIAGMVVHGKGICGERLPAAELRAYLPQLEAAARQAVAPRLGKGGQTKHASLVVLASSAHLKADDLDIMTQQERELYLRGLVRAYGADTGLVVEHHDPVSGRTDFHLVFINSVSGPDNRPRCLRSRFSGKPHELGRAASDRLHNQINASRLPAGLGRIPTMPEVSRQKKASLLKDKGLSSLAAQLAAKGVDDWNQLPQAIRELGYTVTRHNQDSVSVKFPGSKRACRYRRDNLQPELEEALEAVSRPIPAPVMAMAAGEDESPPVLAKLQPPPKIGAPGFAQSLPQPEPKPDHGGQVPPPPTPPQGDGGQPDPEPQPEPRSSHKFVARLIWHPGQPVPLTVEAILLLLHGFYRVIELIDHQRNIVRVRTSNGTLWVLDLLLLLELIWEWAGHSTALEPAPPTLPPPPRPQKLSPQAVAPAPPPPQPEPPQPSARAASRRKTKRRPKPRPNQDFGPSR